MEQAINNIFKPMTFWGLLQQQIEYSDKQKKVVIPIIQRPYTQGGRPDDPEIREKGKRFCNYLISQLKNGKQADVNIIYGSEIDRDIELLDGQQRMTTLYLLYWYVGNKVGRNVIESNGKVFHNFTYQTRTTTRRFFEGLVDEELIAIPSMKDTSEVIENQGWFSPLWRNDQSIKSALEMVQLIENAFDDKENILPYKDYWEKMITCDVHINPFVFSYTTLNELEQTDDLYIKMNARGKLLTPFENLKAGISKIASDNKWEEDVDLKERFLQKMDNGWTDIFWRLRNEDAKVDVNIQAIMTSCMIFYLAENKGAAANEKVKNLFNNVLSLEHTDYTEKEAFTSLTKEFTALERAYLSGFFNDEFLLRYKMKSVSCHCSIKRILECACLKKRNDEEQKYDLNWQTLAYLKAVILYFIDTESSDKIAFQHWMRVIRNIIENTTIDSYTTFISVDKLMKELINGRDDIYGYLSKNEIKSQAAKDQVKEERLKASFRLDSSNNSHVPNIDDKYVSANDKIISELEDTYIGHGKLSFYFGCAGIKTKEDAINYNILNNYKEVADKYLIEDFSDEFRAALFTALDNSFYLYWRSYSYNLEEWKYCIGDKGELLAMVENNHFCYNYIKDVVMRLVNEFNNNISSLLDNYDCSNLPGWKQKIIKNPGLLTKHCPSKRITIGVSRGVEHCNLLFTPRAGVENCKKIQ